MLLYLLYPLKDIFGVFNVFRYISFRTIWAVITSLVIIFIVGPNVIYKLQKLQIKQHIRKLGPKSHIVKAGTPTMGGILILFSVLLSTILWGDLTNFYLWLSLGVTFFFGGIGAVDDYLKKSTKSNERGLTATIKFLALGVVALVAVIILYSKAGYTTKLAIPFLKLVVPDLGWGYVPLGIFILVGSSNAVNLTDGLDGLAAGAVLVAVISYLVLAYLTGNINTAVYLQIFYIAGVGELAVFLGAIIGAVMGFLWYNSYPAQIFMGDTGSLSLGGAIGITALSTKHEILLILIGGIFVVETMSVIFQVTYFKISHGKRIFLMAPLHHHFELKGWSEPKVIVRFWIIAIILALLAISTLKLR